MIVDTPITVRYADTDMMGVVYHGNYLLYFEDGRVDYLQKNGFSYTAVEDAGYVSPIYHVDIQYGAPLRYGERGFVRTSVEAVHATRTVYRQQVFREGDDPETARPLVDGLVTVCLVDKETFQPVSQKRALPELYSYYQQEVAAQRLAGAEAE